MVEVGGCGSCCFEGSAELCCLAIGLGATSFDVVDVVVIIVVVTTAAAAAVVGLVVDWVCFVAGAGLEVVAAMAGFDD